LQKNVVVSLPGAVDVGAIQILRKLRIPRIAKTPTCKATFMNSIKGCPCCVSFLAGYQRVEFCHFEVSRFENFL